MLYCLLLCLFVVHHMSTIDELMTGKAPGEIKVALPDRCGWFQPYFRDVKGDWFGLNELGDPERLPCFHVGTIYQEPKPTKVVYEWIYEFIEGAWIISTKLVTEEGAKDLFGSLKYQKTGRSFEVECE